MKTAAEIAAESRARQGLPRHVDDVSALDRLATLLAPTPATSAPDRVPAGAVRGADIGVAEVHRNLQTADKRTPAAPPAGSTSTRKARGSRPRASSDNDGRRVAAGEA